MRRYSSCRGGCATEELPYEEDLPQLWIDPDAPDFVEIMANEGQAWASLQGGLVNLTVTYPRPYQPIRAAIRYPLFSREIFFPSSRITSLPGMELSLPPSCERAFTSEQEDSDSGGCSHDECLPSGFCCNDVCICAPTLLEEEDDQQCVEDSSATRKRGGEALAQPTDQQTIIVSTKKKHKGGGGGTATAVALGVALGVGIPVGVICCLILPCLLITLLLLRRRRNRTIRVAEVPTAGTAAPTHGAMDNPMYEEAFQVSDMYAH